MAFVERTLTTLATGYILFFFSERLFWTAFRPGDHLGDLALTWLAYSVLACVFLNVVARFEVHGIARVILAGALYGWLAEGALVGTLYGTEDSAPFPLSLIWTGVSWHALISVLVGWHLLRRALGHPRCWRTLALSAGVGLFWGGWATFLWNESPPVTIPIPQFAAHAFVCAGLLMLSYAAVHRLEPRSGAPRRLGLGFALAILAVFYAGQVARLGWRPLFVLPPLLGGILILLRRAGGSGFVSDDSQPDRRRLLRNLPALLAMPGVATGLYALQLSTETGGAAPLRFYQLSPYVGGALFLWACYRVGRGRAVSPSPPEQS